MQSAGISEFSVRKTTMIEDIIKSVQLKELLHMLSIGEIQRRFKRTILGPFWVTINLGIFIFSVGWLFSSLWGRDINTFMPFFSTGFIVWMFISSLLNESCNSYVYYESMLKQVSIPKMMFPMVTVLRNLIVFFHHMAIYVIIAIFFDVNLGFNTLLAIPGLFLLTINGLFISFIIGCMCARYRDVEQIIASFLQLAIFVTPVFWPPELLSHKKIIFINSNPLYHYISILRKPLIGMAPDALNWSVVLFCTIILALISNWIYKHKSQNIIFWI